MHASIKKQGRKKIYKKETKENSHISYHQFQSIWGNTFDFLNSWQPLNTHTHTHTHTHTYLLNLNNNKSLKG